MKLNSWIIFGAMLSSSLFAEQLTNPPPAAPLQTSAPAPASTNVPPSGTNAAAVKAEKKKTAKKKAEKKTSAKKKDAVAELKTVPLVAGPAVVIASNVNVRGQA